MGEFTLLSPHVFVFNGVKQGGILSPLLFNVYIESINHLSVKLNASKYSVGEMFVCLNIPNSFGELLRKYVMSLQKQTIMTYHKFISSGIISCPTVFSNMGLVGILTV